MPGYAKQGRDTFREGVSSYKPSSPFAVAILDAMKLEALIRPSETSPIVVLDAMGGPGGVGVMVGERYATGIGPNTVPVQIVFNDIRFDVIEMLKAEGKKTILCDVRDIGIIYPKSFDVAVVRFGLKDLPKGELAVVLKSLYASLIPGGRIVIGDMTAYSKEGQNGIIQIHGTKQVLAGRIPSVEGFCYIPRQEEWIEGIRVAGFEDVAIDFTGISKVNIGTSWKGQFGEIADEAQRLEALKGLARHLAAVNKTFSNEADVKLEGEEVEINFPVEVYSGNKPT
ncbi:MAG: class I SAM-dependent methyltransferase [Candidatus Micrarchaeaceae archaeon]